MKIKLCRHNRWTDELQSRLNEQCTGELKVKDCLKQCKICRKQPLVQLKKQVLTGEAPDELIRQLNEITAET